MKVKQLKIYIYSKKIYNRIKYFLKYIKSLPKIYNKNYQYYLFIKKEYEKSYQEGFAFHQNEVKNDPELLKWVIKESYLE